MQSFGKFKPQVFQILAGVAAGLLLVGVACGAAATAKPSPTSAPTPGAPVVVARPTLTATPTSTPAPAKPVVNPGKVTIMVGDLGDKRFDPAVAGSPLH